MAWLSANLGTLFVLSIVIALVGFVIWKMVSDRRKGITACDTCGSADGCAIHAAGETCGHPKNPVEGMEPQIKKVVR